MVILKTSSFSESKQQRSQIHCDKLRRNPSNVKAEMISTSLKEVNFQKVKYSAAITSLLERILRGKPMTCSHIACSHVESERKPSISASLSLALSLSPTEIETHLHLSCSYYTMDSDVMHPQVGRPRRRYFAIHIWFQKNLLRRHHQ